MLNIGYEKAFLVSLAFTIIIEASVLVLLVKWVLKYENSRKKILLAGFLPSFATLPYLWFILPIVVQDRFWYVLSGEIGVFVFEILFIQGILDIERRKAILISFLCNLISFLLGLYVLSPLLKVI